MNVFTELVLESREAAKSAEGVSVAQKTLRHGLTRCDVCVENDAAASALGRKKGRYITIEAGTGHLREKNENIYLAKQIAKALADLITPLGLPKDFLALVAGIGNRGMTADALGPRVVDNIVVTRHFLDGGYKTELRFSPVCAIAPGVLGATGIETFEVIKGLCEKIKPALVLVIDSLAARRTQRISATFQLSDTGLTPGGGLGNNRPALNAETLSVPVIAVGVPFVVYAHTMGQDVAEELLRHGACSEKDISRTLKKVINGLFGDLVVTPKDIEQLITDCAFAVSLGINLALHPKLSAADLLAFAH